jgi:hypothetical protein
MAAARNRPLRLTIAGTAVGALLAGVAYLQANQVPASATIDSAPNVSSQVVRTNGISKQATPTPVPPARVSRGS